VHSVDNLTTFMCQLSKNLEASTSWSRNGLSRPVIGLLYIIKMNQYQHTYQVQLQMSFIPLPQQELMPPPTQFRIRATGSKDTYKIGVLTFGTHTASVQYSYTCPHPNSTTNKTLTLSECSSEAAALGLCTH
jgi:hypothetical protein